MQPAASPPLPSPAPEAASRPEPSLWRQVLAYPWRARLAQLIHTLRHWPWAATVLTLRERLREDSLGVRASSLTFTTLLALVPLLTVMLAVFSAFPMFKGFQGALEEYFLKALIPDTIAKPVLRSLTQFAGNARTMGSMGLVLLVASAMAMMLTFDRTLNRIWRVRRERPVMQRVLVYWGGITLGPLAMGIALTIGSYALSAAQAATGGYGFVLGLAEFALLAAAGAMVYHYVPNTSVKWSHAWAGAVFVAVAVEVCKVALGWYVKAVPTYSAMYGAFATAPILLLWVYVMWLIVLLGAVVAAYAPSLAARIVRRPETAGFRFELALEVLQQLRLARSAGAVGRDLPQLARSLHADPLQVDPVLERLEHIGWVGRLAEVGPQGQARFVLLCEPERTPGRPLVDELLLAPGPSNLALRERAQVATLSLHDMLPDQPTAAVGGAGGGATGNTLATMDASKASNAGKPINA